MFKPTPVSAIPPWGIPTRITVAVRIQAGTLVVRSDDGTSVTMKLNQRLMVTRYERGTLTADQFGAIGGPVVYRVVDAVRLQSGRLDWDGEDVLPHIRPFLEREMSKRSHPAAQKRARFREQKAARR